MRAYRRRLAGLRQDEAPGDARRGAGVRLGAPLTNAELLRGAGRLAERVGGYRLSA